MSYLQTPTIHRPLRARIYETFLQVPAVCFTLVLLTDVAYWQTANLMWHNFSSWLLFAGLVGGAVAAVALLVDYLLELRWGVRINPFYPIGVAVAWLLALLNSLIHAGDGWTAIVPWGLALSALTFLVMLGVATIGGPFTYDERD